MRGQIDFPLTDEQVEKEYKQPKTSLKPSDKSVMRVHKSAWKDVKELWKEDVKEEVTKALADQKAKIRELLMNNQCDDGVCIIKIKEFEEL